MLEVFKNICDQSTKQFNEKYGEILFIKKTYANEHGPFFSASCDFYLISEEKKACSIYMWKTSIEPNIFKLASKINGADDNERAQDICICYYDVINLSIPSLISDTVKRIELLTNMAPHERIYKQFNELKQRFDELEQRFNDLATMIELHPDNELIMEQRKDHFMGLATGKISV